MKVSRTLTSAVTAAAFVGAISLAYAQTTTPDSSGSQGSPPATQGQTMQNQGSTMSTPSTQTPAAGTATTDSPAVQTERPAQADRN